jgi:hypothetical protein
MYPFHGYISLVLPVFIIILNQFSVQLLLTTSLRKGGGEGGGGGDYQGAWLTLAARAHCMKKS